MAASLLSFQLFGSFHDCELSNRSIPNRPEFGRLATASVSLQSIQESHKLFGSKLLEFRSNYDSFQKAQVQHLVDRLHWCAEEGLQTETRILHGHVMRSDFDDDNMLVLLNHVMYAYLKCSDFKSAKLLFDYLPRKNVFSWSVLIRGFNEQALFHDGLDYFTWMLEDGVLPDGFTYSALLQSCIGINSIDLGHSLHAQIIVRGFSFNIVVSTALLNMYAKLGKVDQAYKVFSSMDAHNDVSWNAIISGLTSNGRHLEAFDHFVKMKAQGFLPNRYTLVSVLKAVGMLGDVNKGKKVHGYVAEHGFQDNIFVGTALIDMYAKCGELQEARSVFDMNFVECGENGPWNAMIAGYALCKFSEEALRLYIEMCQKGVKTDLYTYCSVLDAVANLKSLRLAKEMHSLVSKLGYNEVMNPSVENAIADAYSKCGSLEEVEKIFNRMESRDIVSWTTIITGYSQSCKFEEALIMFSKMREEGFSPNNFTLASLLTASANLCYLEYGRQLHALLYKLGFEAVSYVETALIDMYAKGGSIHDAGKVFNMIANPDIVSFTAILSGHASHGSAVHALEHFKKMEMIGIKPNSVTFLCVLFACSHGGLIEEGLQFFWSMEKDYGIVPSMEHYACVVDLLGRVGRLDEAFEFISKMAVEPNEMVWQSLLAASRVYGNVEFGEMAARKILALRPEYSSTYVLMSNMYSEAGSFEDGFGMRKAMKERGVRKEAGCSWISVEGKIHKFYAGDTTHALKEEIYAKLDEMRGKLKDLGYVLDLKYALFGED